MKAQVAGQEAEILTLVLPYAEADRQTPYWARGDDDVDWSRGGREAERCTVAFAAVELRDHLQRTLPSWTIRFSAGLPVSGPVIVLGPAATLRAELGVKLTGVPKDPQGYVIRSLSKQRLVLRTPHCLPSTRCPRGLRAP